MEKVIIIRSLVPGGAAQLDGRLVPGDRLIFVNNVRLESASLDEAVQALKGAPRGRVLLGVAKPLPLPDIGESSVASDFMPVSNCISAGLNLLCLQCFDAVGWAAGRASGL